MNPYPPPKSSTLEEEIRYDITFSPKHEIIGEFEQKQTTNPLNSSSTYNYVSIKSINRSIKDYTQSCGMKVGDVIEKIRTDGPDGIEHKVINLDDAKSLLEAERPITLTCFGKRYNKDYAMYWAWEKRKEYKKEFPHGTPIVCACDKGRFEDVKLLIAGHDVNGSNDNNMTSKEYVNQFGKHSHGGHWNESTPLQAAASYEHLQIVQYLIEECEADPDFADRYGYNALHWAADYNYKNTDVIQFLLKHMSLDSINKKVTQGSRIAPLDYAYRHKNFLIRQEKIDLIRKHGGKTKCELDCCCTIS